ncbi:MAG TPA: hypothetical protein VLI67_04800, partial [Vicinamibacteria bacterium]|nr:hypothetical protein [Vicinamibacteria bacterium]
YLAMLTGLLSVRPLLAVWKAGSTRRPLALRLGLVAAALAAGAWVSGHEDVGEMRFGPFDHLVPGSLVPLLRGSFLVAGGGLLAELCHRAIRERDRVSVVVACAVVPYLLVSSATRPAQRYLLVVLPLLLFYLAATTREAARRFTRWAGVATAVLFVPMNVVVTLHGVAQGRAAEDMADWIRRHDKLTVTDPGAIAHHAGQHFPIQRARARFTVTEVDCPDRLHREEFRLMGSTLKAYSLCPTSGDPEHPSPRPEAR